MTTNRLRSAIVVLVACVGMLPGLAVQASPTCPDEQAAAQLPTDLPLCAALDDVIRHPSRLPLGAYEAKLDEFLSHMCHRRDGWAVDKRVRDTGPWIGAFQNGRWSGKYFGTHAPVLIWYSPDMLAWLKANRPDDKPAPATAAPVPDGAVMVKEMYPMPAAACADVDPIRLLPKTNGAAVMVRDGTAAHDGWFWGWYGWPGSGWAPDWPAKASSPYPNMGFGQYCTNCHASATDNQTFASLRNIKGEAGDPLVFLSQNFFLDPSWPSTHARILAAAQAAGPIETAYNAAFAQIFWSVGGPPPRDQIWAMPPQTYDNVWAKPGPPTPSGQFIASDQCVGCHSAGGTGLQFDMTEPGPDGKLINISPYGAWRGSPMGLAGRDPIFFAQLASETETFHPKSSGVIQDTCLGCHGILGQRQFAIDSAAKTGVCGEFSRETVNATPFPSDDPVAALAHYGALARDGISCASCHNMVLGKSDTDKYRGAPQNRCVEQRQAALNPGLNGFARTVTGSFLVGPADKLYGPFKDPKTKPMHNAIGRDPEHNRNITSSDICGTCHTVHLPILHRDKTVGHVYEQTTYPEWAFSDYRTGNSPDGALPLGAGPQAQSCQGCHMPGQDAAGNPYRSKIASIQENTNFPQAENALPAKDIDLPTRAGFAKHTLVGLNVFLLKMAAQFPDLLGIRAMDPMLTDKGVDSIPTAEAAMLDQARHRTASVTVGDVRTDGAHLNARVTVINKVGHKFPSGVGFRRAFVEFSVLDAGNKVLWSSGRTDGAGVIVDQAGTPIAGELWWTPDCSVRIDPEARIHQPHYQTITRQDQAQIYQELVSTPPEVAAPRCEAGTPPRGRLTASFMSICTKVKDNRLLPRGFLKLDDRVRIAAALGAGRDMADEAGPAGVGDDPDYRGGGGDSLLYRVPLAELGGEAAAVQATLYYQATPPFYLQDRFCTSAGADTKRLFYVAGNLNLAETPAQDWKLRLVTSGPVAVR